MKICTSKTDENILSAYEKCAGEKPVILELAPNASLIDLFDRLSEINEDVLWTHPVYVLHDISPVKELLKTYDFVIFKAQKSNEMDFSFFAAKPKALQEILGNLENYEFDNSVSYNSNLHNLVLNTLGKQCKLRNSNNEVIKLLDATLKGTGTIATHCGTPVILQVINSAKLIATDIIPQIMENKKNIDKQPVYHE